MKQSVKVSRSIERDRHIVVFFEVGNIESLASLGDSIQLSSAVDESVADRS